MRKIASRYAKSLLQLAVEEDVLTHVHKDMHCFDQICSSNRNLVSTLKNPLIRRNKKLTILKIIFQNTIHPITLRFFAMVTQRFREALLPVMAQAFLTQYDQHQGIKTAQVTTAFPLSDRTALELHNVMKQISPCKHIRIEQSVDRSLIGGYVLRIDDRRLDQSLRKKLLTLQGNCVIEIY